MNLKPLADLVETAGHGVQAKTLFLQMLPAECERGILLRAPLAGIRIRHELPGYYKGEFQLIVRGHGYDDTLVKAVIATLTLSDVSVGPQHFNYCRPRVLPVAFPLSKGNLVEFTVPFDCCYTEP